MGGGGENDKIKTKCFYGKKYKSTGNINAITRNECFHVWVHYIHIKMREERKKQREKKSPTIEMFASCVYVRYLLL